jgi:hypothetical protein
MTTTNEKYTFDEFIAKCIELGNYGSVCWLEGNDDVYVEGVSSSNIHFHSVLSSTAAVVCYLDSQGLIDRKALRKCVRKRKCSKS